MDMKVLNYPKRFFSFALLFFWLLSCGDSKTKVRNPDEKSEATRNYEKENRESKINKDSILKVHIHESSKSSNSDTALSYFLYQNHDNFNIEYEVQYQRFDLEYIEQVELIGSLYQFDSDLQSKMKNLDSIREKYIQYVREFVISEYEEYNGISGRDFDFLAQRKDSLAISLVSSLIENDLASDYEKNFGVQKIIEHFGDSTLYLELNK